MAVEVEPPVELAPVMPMRERSEVDCEEGEAEVEDEDAAVLFGVPPMTVSPITLVTKTLP